LFEKHGTSHGIGEVSPQSVARHTHSTKEMR
jgi:hypothetical protein